MSRNLSTAEAARILGIEPARVREIVRSGVFEPRRRGRRYLLSFQDLVVLRAAKGLLDARVPAARVQRALAALARELPPERPLSGLRIYADGRDVAVCNGETAWQPETGQLVLDFELDSLAKLVDDARRARPVPEAAGAAARARAEFERALDLEDEAPAEAALAYRRAVALDPDLVDAWVNLGRLVHEAGDAANAVAFYQEAAAKAPGDPIVHFNLALALEDAEGPAAAAAAYEAALALDPDFADAHFNLASLCEQQGRQAEAIRHYSAYKRLTKS
jgi:tetratricopeptide (TPR) repeat protein